MITQQSPQKESLPDSPYCVFLAGSVKHNWDYAAKGMRITIESCRRSNPNIPIAVIIDDDSLAIRQLFAGCEIIVIDPSELQLGLRQDLGIGVYFIFYIHLLSHYKKVLYLDGDTVILGNLTPLFEMEGHLVARRFQRDLSIEYVDPNLVMQKEGVPQSADCINTGVVLFDMEYWGNGKLKQEFFSLAEEYGWHSFKNPDQGFFNIICWRNSIKDNLPKPYNTFVSEIDKSHSHYTKVSETGISFPCVSDIDIKIIHFIGPLKPWHFAKEGYFLHKRCYRYYEQFLPLSNRIIQHMIVYPNFIKRQLKSILNK
ncbi:LPS:glycosyltransferase [Nostoc sp. PCC 7524]|uniref:LPS glycosyltransferase n=1 Tax=Nostoc sp. (strain ATCC 29411 / PCC 7524) TaxID=28072 RepID=UPI00029ECECA|nr:LPS glycosyltransferase [Nostoc sp. PCC 7524]AFY47108.1 LPS:glycosyltransferase [Nostoc sp. PCC 7524]